MRISGDFADELTQHWIFRHAYWDSEFLRRRLVMVAMRGSPVSRRAVQRFRQLAITAVGSVKIKLLLGICIFLTLILLFVRASTSVQLKQHYDFVDQSAFQRFVDFAIICFWSTFIVRLVIVCVMEHVMVDFVALCGILVDIVVI